MIYILSFSILFNIILLSFVLTDLYPIFRQWFGRIHIGRWVNTVIWRNAILNRTKIWLRDAPTVCITDNKSFILWDRLKGRFRSKTIQSWQDAGLLLGVLSAHEKDIAYSWVNSKLDEKGMWREKPMHVDAALLGYAMLSYVSECQIKSDTIKPAMDYVYDLILSFRENNTVLYRKSTSSIRFVDTLGFICPFLLKYGLIYQKKEAIILAFLQLEEYDMALLPKFGFPCHAFDLKNKLPRGVYDWGRGIGWYILALVEGKRSLENHEKVVDLNNRIVHLAENLIPFQNQYGGFSSMVFDLEAYPESSITALAGLLFHEAWLLTGKQSFYKARQLTIKSLMMVTQRNGAIDYCQGDTKGIGFYSITFSYMPFVQGMSLLLINRINTEKCVH